MLTLDEEQVEDCQGQPMYGMILISTVFSKLALNNVTKTVEYDFEEFVTSSVFCLDDKQQCSVD